jgi:hypothetical protein
VGEVGAAHTPREGSPGPRQKQSSVSGEARLFIPRRSVRSSRLARAKEASAAFGRPSPFQGTSTSHRESDRLRLVPHGHDCVAPRLHTFG